MQSEFFVIKLINSDGTRGYVVDSPEGVKIAVDKLAMEVTQFTTKDEALAFVRKYKLEKKGVKASVQSNKDLMAEPAQSNMQPVTGLVYYLQNQRGDNCFYNAKEEAYYFEDRATGFCIWDSMDSLKQFVSEMKFPFATQIKVLTGNNN